MRVAFVVSRFPVVSETFVVNMAAGLIDAGHELDIFALNGLARRLDVLHPSVTRYDLLARTRTPALPAGWPARLAAAPASARRAVAAQGWRALRTVPPLARHARARSLRLLFEAAMLGRGDFDIVHCQFATLALPVLQHRAAGTLRGKVVVHIRGYDVTEELNARSAHGYRRIFREADLFIANSRHFRDVAVAAGCPPQRLHVVPSGIELDAFPFRPPTPPASGPVRIVGVGRLVEKKGFVHAVRALARLRAAGRDVTLDLVGDGPLQGALAAEAERLAVADRVRLHGRLAADGVAAVLQTAHVFVAPSVTAADGNQDAATNTVKEAMATGVPVVATRHGGLPELVVDGETGVLVPEGDAEQLAAALARLIDAPATWAGLAAAARRRVEDEAANVVVTRQILDLYAGLLA